MSGKSITFASASVFRANELSAMGVANYSSAQATPENNAANGQTFDKTIRGYFPKLI